MNCDGIARWYRWLEYAMFGRALEHTRLQYLDLISASRNALILGDGDGRFLAAFAERNRHASIDVIECSGEMMRLAERRLKRSSAYSCERVRLHCADVRSFDLPAGRYDLIATHFFLDCFTTEGSFDLISRVAAAAAPNAQWLVSEFRQPRAGFGRYRGAITIWASYLFFRVATGLRTNTLPDYSRALAANGFRRHSHHMRSNGMLIAEVWERRERDDPNVCG
jgi:ubiquinone/menaquinone biosynthesis C-methylase UbiE